MLPQFNPEWYKIEKITDPVSFERVVELEHRVLGGDEKLLAPKQLMRNRFKVYSGALLAVIDGVDVGMRTFAPIKYDLLMKDLDQGVDVYPFMDEKYITSEKSPWFYMLSFEVDEDHRATHLRTQYSEVNFPPSHQLLNGAFTEAVNSGSQYILVAAANDITRHIYDKKLGFDLLREVNVEGDVWTLFTYDLKSDSKDVFSRLRNEP